LDDDRIVKNENKHRCQSGDGLAPAGKFLGGSFGVSGTPPVARTMSNSIMPKPLVCISSRAGNRDNAGPSASHDFMTRLTVDSRAATVVAVDHSQSVSLGDLLELSADFAPSSVAAGGGVFHARWLVIWKSCGWNGLV